MDWLDPWWSIIHLGRDFAGTFENELRREVGRDHPLYGIPIEAIGRHDACDDVLYRLLDGSGRVAVVHLTWAQSTSESGPWPMTEIYSDLQTWAEQHMKPEHDEYTT
jgi:hypothetical protein